MMLLLLQHHFIIYSHAESGVLDKANELKLRGYYSVLGTEYESGFLTDLNNGKYQYWYIVDYTEDDGTGNNAFHVIGSDVELDFNEEDNSYGHNSLKVAVKNPGDTLSWKRYYWGGNGLEDTSGVLSSSGSGFRINNIYNFGGELTYKYKAGDTVLFDNAGDAVTIKASFTHAIEMNVRQYINGNVTTQWLTQVADNTYIVPDGYLEFEFITVSDGEDIEIVTKGTGVNIGNPTISKITMVKGETEFNKVGIENRRSDNVQVNVHAIDTALIDAPYTHVIYYQKVNQLNQTFWRAVGQSIVGNKNPDMSIVLKPHEKVDIYNVRLTTEIEYLDKFDIVVTKEIEDFNGDNVAELPYYEVPPYIPDYNYGDNVGDTDYGQVTEGNDSTIMNYANTIKGLSQSTGQVGQVMNEGFAFMPWEIRTMMIGNVALILILKVLKR